MTWVTCDEVVEGDVVRFTESVWERRGPKRRQRIVRTGERTVTGQILVIEEEWVYLIIMVCEGDKPLAKDEEVKRKVSTVLKRCERLLWSEEPVRAGLTSRFVRPEAGKALPRTRKRRKTD